MPRHWPHRKFELQIRESHKKNKSLRVKTRAEKAKTKRNHNGLMPWCSSLSRSPSLCHISLKPLPIYSKMSASTFSHGFSDRGGEKRDWLKTQPWWQRLAAWIKRRAILSAHLISVRSFCAIHTRRGRPEKIEESIHTLWRTRSVALWTDEANPTRTVSSSNLPRRY